MKAADGRRLSVLVSSELKHRSQGEPLLIRTTVFVAGRGDTLLLYTDGLTEARLGRPANTSSATRHCTPSPPSTPPPRPRR